MILCVLADRRPGHDRIQKTFSAPITESGYRLQFLRAVPQPSVRYAPSKHEYRAIGTEEVRECERRENLVPAEFLLCCSASRVLTPARVEIPKLPIAARSESPMDIVRSSHSELLGAIG
jgi:hypothetical protein